MAAKAASVKAACLNCIGNHQVDSLLEGNDSLEPEYYQISHLLDLQYLS